METIETTLTPEQISLRRNGITSTDVAAIVGVHPYRSALDVQLDKRGMAAPFEDTERAKWGRILEEPIRADYAIRHGVMVSCPGTVVHENGRHMATPDGFVMGDSRQPLKGLEVKTHTTWLRAGYGEPGTDEVPDHELIQCAWGMHVCNLPAWDLVFFCDNVPRDYFIERDAELEDMLITKADAWWEQYIVKGDDVPPDGSKAYDSEIARRFKEHRGEFVKADDEALGEAIRLRELRNLIASYEAAKTKAEQKLKLAIGEAAGIELDDGTRITWKKSKDSQVTDWKAAFHSLAIDLDAEPDTRKHIVSRHTKTREGTRRFVTPRDWSK